MIKTDQILKLNNIIQEHLCSEAKINRRFHKIPSKLEIRKIPSVHPQVTVEVDPTDKY